MKLKKLAKELLIEQSRSQRITQDEAIGWIQSNASSFHPEKHRLIWRGVKSRNDYMTINPANFSRTSANTKNYYTLIVDNDPRWSKFPKRSQSIICATSWELTMTYGDSYVVIPKDGSTIGVCPRSDFWWSFGDIHKKLNQPFTDLTASDANQIVNELHKAIFDEQLTDSSFSKMKDGLNRLNVIKDWTDEQISDLHKSRGWEIHSLAFAFKDSNFDSFYDFFADIFSPKRFNVLKQPLPKIPKEREVWTDSESVMIYKDEVKSIFYKLYPDADLHKLFS